MIGAGGPPPRPLERGAAAPASASVLLRADGRVAYPVVDGVPVLLAPEALVADSEREPFVVGDERYVEAYDEMGFYNASAAATISAVAVSPEAKWLTSALAATARERRTFPEPRARWIHLLFEAVAQYDAYTHVAPLAGKRVLDLGGRGVEGLKMLLAGAAETWHVSPMLDELRFSHGLAAHVGLAERFHRVAAVGEELPFEDGTFDVVFTSGSLHHTVTELSLAECARVLRPGGRFAAVEPWKGRLYRLGIGVFGKREAVGCVPLTPERAAPLFTAFNRARVVHHGALTRYPLLALFAVGLRPPDAFVWWVTRLDDAISRVVPPLSRAGTAVALLGLRGS